MKKLFSLHILKAVATPTVVEADSLEDALDKMDRAGTKITELTKLSYESDVSLSDMLSDKYENVTGEDFNVNPPRLHIQAFMFKVSGEGPGNDVVETEFNGTPEEAQAYYKGNRFNLGTVEDKIYECNALFIKEL